MKKLIYTLALVLILNLAFNIQNSQAQWVRTSGPGGGNVNCFVVNGNDIYAGLDYSFNGGVYVSNDNGATWTGRGMQSSNIRALTFSGTYLFAASSSSGVYLSTNNGLNWFIANNGLSGQNVYYFAVNGTSIFAGTSSNGVYVSTNQGGSWTLSGLSGMDISAMISVGNSVFAGTPFNGLYRTTNNGISWTSVNTGLSSTFIMSLAASGSNLFVGAGNNVFISNNNGNSWTQTSVLSGSGTIYALAANGTNLLAGTQEQGFYRSTNNGASWTQSPCNKWVNTITFKGTVAFVGASLGYISNEGVYRSTNFGSSWDPSGITNQTVTSLTSNGSNVFAGNTKGVFLTTNNGVIWNAVNNGLLNLNVQCLTSGGNYTFAGTYDGGVYRTANNGGSWSSVNTGLISQNVTALIYNNGNLYAGTNGAGVFLSINNGDTWTGMNTGLTDMNIKSFAVSGSTILTGTQAGVFMSINNGGNWSPIGLASYYINALTINGGSIIASAGYNGLYRTTNNGVSWLTCGFSSQGVNTLISNGNKIFCGSGFMGVGYGIYMSTDYGQNWINRNQGLNTPSSVRSLLVANNYIFAGTDTQSVLRRDLADIIGIKNVSTEIPSAYSLSQNYPNPFNPTTKIRFDVGKFPSFGGVPEGRGGLVTLIIFDILGREIQTLVNERLQPGTYETTFDGSALSSGIYFYKLTSGDFTQTKRLTLIK